ncbi:uncharacterized protein LDX57_008374 [Aspergillus melleus]|uniref:uncharacterized protein n=1 Tax=Aspergillus melleus TaxID=138277 RepID=UPI001E8EA6CB|nr:uncharacterized protein LDX57_008374 [Aspergillus melleus]KAH8430712.1 hypothetical protein LDX57_008374 [Aspergillus melleus]
MNSYYSNSLPSPPPHCYPPNYNYPHPPGPPNYNYNYPPGPPQNYIYPPPTQQPQNSHYNNHNNNIHYSHTPPPPSPQPYQQTTPPSTLSITSSPHDSSLTILTPDTNPHSQPQYTAKINKYSKPHITLFRGSSHPNQQPPLGTAIMHSFSSTTDCTLTSTPFPVKYSSLSGNFTLTHPILGTCKWKANQLTGTSLELLEDSGSGRKLAKIKVISGLSALSGSKKAKAKGKRLEIFVPLPEPVMDVVVLSALVVMVGTRGMMEAGVEVAGAVAGI